MKATQILSIVACISVLALMGCEIDYDDNVGHEEDTLVYNDDFPPPDASSGGGGPPDTSSGGGGPPETGSGGGGPPASCEEYFAEWAGYWLCKHDGDGHYGEVLMTLDVNENGKCYLVNNWFNDPLEANVSNPPPRTQSGSYILLMEDDVLEIYTNKYGNLYHCERIE